MAFIENALGVGPAQQAQKQQAQQNYSQGVSSDASQLAQQQQQQQLANMFMRYQQYMQQNPNPAQGWKPIQGPQQNTGTVGGGMIPSGGYSGAPPPQQPQNLSGLLMPQGASGAFPRFAGAQQ